MKKTLLALSVMCAATSAQAIELYNQDGVTVDLKGDVEVRYVAEIEKDNEFKQEIDDADFGIDTRYQVNDDLQVGAYFELSLDDGDRASDDAGVGNIYVGFYTTNYGSLKIGKLDTQLDDAGIGSDHIFGVSSFFDNADVGGDEAIRYDYDQGMFYAGFGVIQDKYDSDDYGKDGGLFDAKVGVRVADFDITAFYGTIELNNVVAPRDENLLALEVRYAGVENLNLEAAYYNTEKDVKAGSKSDSDTFAIAADYSFTNGFSVAGGVSNTDHSAAAAEDYTQWFANVGYGLAPNTTVYAEIGDNDLKDTDMGYGVGIKSTF